MSGATRAPRLIVALALLVLAGAAVVGACGGSPGRPGYAGYWKAADEARLGGPLLVHIERNEGSFSVDGLRFLGAAADKATIEGGALVVKSGPSSRFSVRFTREDDGRRLVMNVLDEQRPGQPVVSLDLVPAGGTPAELAAQLEEQDARADVARVKQGLQTIFAGIQVWAAETGGDAPYPDAGEVRPNGGLRQYVPDWPLNPYTGSKMKPGLGLGDYTYLAQSGGRTMRLTGHLPNGEELTLP